MTHTKIALTLAALAAASLLSACEPLDEEMDDESTLRGCATIVGTTTESDPDPNTCTGCGTTSKELVADGDATSFAVISMPANQGGTGKVKIQAANTVTYPANTTQVGLLHSIQYGTSDNVSITLRTSLNGVDQEDFQLVPAGTDGSASADPDNPYRVSFTTTKNWNAAELIFTRADGTTSSGAVTGRVHEFCSNAN